VGNYRGGWEGDEKKNTETSPAFRAAPDPFRLSKLGPAGIEARSVDLKPWRGRGRKKKKWACSCAFRRNQREKRVALKIGRAEEVVRLVLRGGGTSKEKRKTGLREHCPVEMGTFADIRDGENTITCPDNSAKVHKCKKKNQPCSTSKFRFIVCTSSGKVGKR